MTILINSILYKCDIHALLCNKENCIRCLVIQSNQEILKNILITTCISILYTNIKLVYRLITYLPNMIYTNLVFMKVKLNE